MVSQEQTEKLFQTIDKECAIINDSMEKLKFSIQKIANETKSINGSEGAARRRQQANVISKLQNVAKNFDQIQKRAKEQYKERLKREYKIGFIL